MDKVRAAVYRRSSEKEYFEYAPCAHSYISPPRGRSSGCIITIMYVCTSVVGAGCAGVRFVYYNNIYMRKKLHRRAAIIDRYTTLYV